MNARKNLGWKTGLFLALSTMILIFAATALAQGPHGRSGQGRGSQGDPGHRLEMLAEKLELSEDQVAAIEKIQEAGRAQGLEIHKEMMRLRNELEGEMLKDEPSEKVALDLVNKIGDLRTELQTNRLKSRLGLRGQLTPDQRDKMLVTEENGRRGRGRRGGRGEGSRCDGECDGSGHGRGQRGARGQ